MTILPKNKRKLPAIGLLEILIVLAIVSVTMVGAFQISLQGLRVVKNNEVADYANTLMLQALEIAKNPADVKVSSNSTITNFNGSYRLQRLADNTAVMWLVTTSLTPASGSTCSKNSTYYLDISNSGATTSPSIICLQLRVQQQQNLGINVYQITSRVMYSLNGQVIEQEVVGFRRNAFQYKAP